MPEAETGTSVRSRLQPVSYLFKYGQFVRVYEFRQTMPTQIKAVHPATELVFGYSRIRDEEKARRHKKRLSDFFISVHLYACHPRSWSKLGEVRRFPGKCRAQSPLFVFKNGAINCLKSKSHAGWLPARDIARIRRQRRQVHLLSQTCALSSFTMVLSDLQWCRLSTPLKVQHFNKSYRRRLYIFWKTIPRK